MISSTFAFPEHSVCGIARIQKSLAILAWLAVTIMSQRCPRQCVSIVLFFPKMREPTHSDVDVVSSIRFDRHQIHSDDCQLMIVNHEFPRCVDGRVHDSQSIRLPLSGLHRKARASCAVHVRSIDQAGIHQRWPFSLGILIQLINRTMRPVIEKEHALINIVVCTCRAVDDESTKHSFPSLQANVGVIP